MKEAEPSQSTSDSLQSAENSQNFSPIPETQPQPTFTTAPNPINNQEQPPSGFNVFRKKIFLFVLLIVFLILLLVSGAFFYFNKELIKPPLSTGEALQELESEPDRLKVAYAQGSKITALDIVSGEKSDIFIAKEGNTSVSEFIWSVSKNVLAVKMCCGDRETGLFIMNGDGSGKKLVHDLYNIANLQWSPDGNFLSFMNHTGQTNENFEEIKVIDTISGNDVMTFNVIDKLQSILAGYFWIPDGNSLVVSVRRVVGEKEIYFESMQVSKDGQVIQTFTDKFVGAAKDNQIFYTKRGNNTTLYVSDIDGQNEKVLFSGGENCEGYRVSSDGLIKKDRLAFIAGGATSPYPKHNPICAMSRVVIYDLKTSNTTTTEPIARTYIWSPAGEYLAVKSDTHASEGWVATEDQKYFNSQDKIDLYSESGQLLKNLETSKFSNSQLAFIYNVPGSTDKVFSQVSPALLARAEDRIIKNDINNIGISSGFYYQKRNKYPESLDELAADGHEGLHGKTPDGQDYGYLVCANGKEAVAFSKLKETGTYWVWSSVSKKYLDIKSAEPPSQTCVYGL